MTKPFDTRTVMTDEEAVQIYNDNPGCGIVAVRDIALQRAREQWGVTGSRQEVAISANGDIRYYKAVPQLGQRPATLYIHDAPKRLTAEERIEKARQKLKQLNMPNFLGELDKILSGED